MAGRAVAVCPFCSLPGRTITRPISALPTAASAPKGELSRRPATNPDQGQDATPRHSAAPGQNRRPGLRRGFALDPGGFSTWRSAEEI